MVLESQSQLGDFPSSLTVKAKYAVWLCNWASLEIFLSFLLCQMFHKKNLFSFHCMPKNVTPSKYFFPYLATCP